MYAKLMKQLVFVLNALVIIVMNKPVHGKKENKDHKKEAIDYNVRIDTRCPDHDKIPINLFCIDEKGNL